MKRPFARSFIWKDQGRVCCWCDHPIALVDATFEHLTPRSHKGSNTWGNLAIACAPCNRARKSNVRGNRRFQLVRLRELRARAAEREQVRVLASKGHKAMHDALNAIRAVKRGSRVVSVDERQTA
jgi:hypothetical protein